MRNYEKIMKESERLQKTICNRCGKEIPVADGCETEGVFHVDYKWGYFRGKTGNDISLTFVNPVTIVFWNNFAYRRK